MVGASEGSVGRARASESHRTSVDDWSVNVSVVEINPHSSLSWERLLMLKVVHDTKKYV